MDSKSLAHYSVVAKIGAGGMGEVYRATDTKLGRDVALKLLPENFASDADRLSRFEREAKLLATLNHTNIAAIYGIEQDGAQRFLVLELVEGEDLSERISRGPIPVEESLAIALQITEALDVAHDQGVVHRDLKPANVKVTPDGHVKVLDFGLAKAFEPETGSQELSHSPTMLASSPTMQGVILGTAAYMSPEQARGKVVDRRADIFAFGCVLYEMLTGRQAFGGETVSDTLASVLKTEADLDALPADTPRAIRRLLERCLDKDPRKRLRDIGEARIVIERVMAGEDDVETFAVPAESGAPSRRRLVWGGAVVLVAALAAVGSWFAKPDAPEPPLRKFHVAVESEQRSRPFEPFISPDGSRVAFVMGGKLFVRNFAELDAREIPGIDDAIMPFWSPDGSYIGYVSDGAMWKAPVSGGNSVKICDPEPSFGGGRGASWTEDGRIVYSYGSSGLFEVSAQGGDPRVILDVDGVTYQDYHEPSVLPGNAGILLVAHIEGKSPDRIELVVGEDRTTIVEGHGNRLWFPQYSATGHIVYRRSGANAGVWAIPFSLSSLSATGEPFLVAADAHFPSVSRNGAMVYLKGGRGGRMQMRWVDRSGAVGDSIGSAGFVMTDLALSPDDRYLAVVESDGSGDTDIWIHDIERGSRTRFTFEESNDILPAWSPGGDRIYYGNTGKDSILVRNADGAGSAIPLVEGREPSVSPDGRYLLYHIQGGRTQQDIWFVELRDDGLPTGPPQPFLATAAREQNGVVSSDGKFIAYMSDESGTRQVYVKRFPGGDGKWQVSVDGGFAPRWSADGRTVYYIADDGCDIMAVPVSTSPVFTLGSPSNIVDCGANNFLGGPGYSFEVARDDSRFIMAQALATNENTVDVSIVVTENWFREFTR